MEWEKSKTLFWMGESISEEKFKTLFESWPQKVFVKDENSFYLFCSQTYARGLKIEADEIAGKSDFDFYPPEIAEKLIADDKQTMEAGEVKEIQEEYFYDGRDLVFHILRIPLKDERGNFAGILGISEDLPEFKESELFPEPVRVQEEEDEGIELHMREDPIERGPVKEEGSSKFSLELTIDHEDCTEEQRQQIYQKILKMSVPEKVRLALAGNRETRFILIHDPTKIVPLAVLRSTRLTGNEILNYAKQKNISEDVVRSISRHKNWMKNYHIKLAIVCHPKTPPSEALQNLPYLHNKDLQEIARNKNVPSFLRRGASQILRRQES